VTRGTHDADSDDDSTAIASRPSGTDGSRPSGTDGPHPSGTDGPHPSGTDGPHPSGTDGSRPSGTDGSRPIGAEEDPEVAEDGAREDAIDLTDLELRGVDGVVADHSASSARTVRPSWVSLLVVVLALPLLVRMYPDFHFWIQSSEPLDLGRASSFVQDGVVPSGYHDRYVTLEGTPDIRNVAVATSSKDKVRYMRLIESEGGLFAVVRTPAAAETKGQTLNYPGRFAGRMARLGDLGRTSWSPWAEPKQYQWLEQFYALENVTRTIDSSPEALVASLRSRPTGTDFAVDSSEGRVRLEPDDRVRLVVERPEARVLLGAEAFTEESASRLIEGLGYPFLKQNGPDETRHRFVVRIPPAERESVQQRLEGAAATELRPADPRREVAVLPMTATFTVPIAELGVDDQNVSFPLGDNTTPPEYDVVGKGLVVGKPKDGRVTVQPAELKAVRLEKPVRLDPDGYAILDGEAPSDKQLFGLLWLFTLLITLGNAVSVGFWWRRHRRLRA